MTVKPDPWVTFESHVDRTANSVLVALLGIGTSLLTAFVLVMIEMTFGWPIHSVYLLFVIPAGAMVSSYGSAAGYWLGLRRLRQRPIGGNFLNAFAASACTFFFVYYIPYYLTRMDDPALGDATFWDYLGFVATQTKIRGMEAGTLFGYVRLFLELAGFSLGTWSILGLLSGNPYCRKCSRYLVVTDRCDRYWFGPDLIRLEMQKFAMFLRNRDLKGAVRCFREEMGIAQEGTKPWRARLTTWECERCRVNRLTIDISERCGQSWSTVIPAKLGLNKKDLSRETREHL